MNHSNGTTRPSHDSLHLRMIRTADNNNVTTFSALLVYNPMNFLNERARCIDDLHAVCFNFLTDIARYTVGTDHNGSARKLFQIFFRTEHLHAAVLKIIYNLFIVDDRSIGINRLFPMFDFLIYGIHRPFDPETEARTFRNRYFHLHSSPFSLFRSYMRSRASVTIFSTTSSIVISELSTRIASFACTSGECSLCIS